MNLMELKKAISQNNINSFYIFTGDEIAILNIYINKIASLFNNRVFYPENLSAAVGRLKSNSLLYKDKYLYVIRDDKEVTTAEKIWDSLKSGKFQHGNTIIFVYSNMDKRGKFYKAFEDYIVSFEALSSDILSKYVAKQLTLSKDRTSYLIEICQNSYNKLLLEMDKINDLSNALSISHDKAFDMCVDNNAFYIPPTGEIFDLLNAILKGNAKVAYNQLQMFVRRGDSPLAIISLLHTNLKAILQVQCASGHKDIGQITGLNGFQIKNANSFVGMYSDKELIRMIKINRFCEKCIKQTGLVDQDIILDFMLVKIF